MNTTTTIQRWTWGEAVGLDGDAQVVERPATDEDVRAMHEDETSRCFEVVASDEATVTLQEVAPRPEAVDIFERRPGMTMTV